MDKFVSRDETADPGDQENKVQDSGPAALWAPGRLHPMLWLSGAGLWLGPFPGPGSCPASAGPAQALGAPQTLSTPDSFLGHRLRVRMAPQHVLFLVC